MLEEKRAEVKKMREMVKGMKEMVGGMKEMISNLEKLTKRGKDEKQGRDKRKA